MENIKENVAKLATLYDDNLTDIFEIMNLYKTGLITRTEANLKIQGLVAMLEISLKEVEYLSEAKTVLDYLDMNNH